MVYEGNCSCGENYVGESVRNVVLRWAENEDPNKQSEPAKHLKYFPDHQFEWKVLTRVLAKHLKYFPDHQFEWKVNSRAPEYTRKRKISEVFLIKSVNSSLNEQLYTIS